MDATALQLLRTGLLVPLKVESEEVLPQPGDSAEFGFALRLRFADDEDDTLEPEDVASWGSLGVAFLLASLAFAGARPRGVSAEYYIEGDEFTVSDFLERLRHERRGLTLDLDYLRGRRVKTRISIAADGTASVLTRGRGKAALDWLAQARGERRAALVARQLE